MFFTTFWDETMSLTSFKGCARGRDAHGHGATVCRICRSPTFCRSRETLFFDGLAPRYSMRPLDHFEGILNYCRTKVALDVLEAINGNIKTLLRRGRGTRTYAIWC